MNQIIIYLVGALILAGITALFRSKWLYLIAPKLYLNTPLSDGQIISLDLYNAGLVSEEDVTVTIRPGCKFELIATSKSTLSVKGNIITVAKLSRFEKVTVLLLIEDKSFNDTDIEGIESKAKKGKIVDSKEKATGPWAGFIGLPLFFLFLIVPFCFGTFIGAEMKMSAWSYLDNELQLFGRTKQLAGYEQHLEEDYSQGKLKGMLNKKINVQLTEVVRYGQLLTLNYTLKNDTSLPLFIGGSIESSAGDSEGIGIRQRYLDTTALAPNEKKLVKMRVYLPEDSSTKIVRASFRFETMANETLSATHAVHFD